MSMKRSLRNSPCFLGCVVVLANACTTNAPEAPAVGLAPSSWRLVEFQSSDDAIGTTRPDDPSLYTMTLNDDGTVALRLNCNRASGSWSAEPSADGMSGAFSFGPLAMTRAFCPPPSMDQSIATQAGFVRSFVRRDGRLYLSLMADGGILVWEPDPAAR
jgi:heat shock protein HslJ